MSRSSTLSLIALLATAGCSKLNPSFSSSPSDPVDLKVGECFHSNGDVGGNPDQISCVQTIGKDGFLKCEGSTNYEGKFQWDLCRWPVAWSRMEYSQPLLRKLACPIPCPSVEGK